MSDNVVSIFPSMRKKEQEEDKQVVTVEETIEETMARNAADKLRLEEDRKKSNKSVTKTYRLKK